MEVPLISKYIDRAEKNVAEETDMFIGNAGDQSRDFFVEGRDEFH